MRDLTRRELLRRAAYAAPIIALGASRGDAAPHASGRPAAMAAMPARAAFDSYGINCHLSYLSGSVWANTDAALQWLSELGVGAARQYLPRTGFGRDRVKLAMSRLSVMGLRWCCPVLVAADATSLDAARAAVNEQLSWLQANTDLALLDSLPGPNEPNSEGGAIADWVQPTRWAMQALWEETRKRSAFDHVLVQGPPLNMKGAVTAVAPDVAALGDLSQWTDRGDAHLYPGAHDPGWQVDERLAVLRPLHPGKPVCVSEGGYTTSIGRAYTGGADLVPEEVAGLYAPKHLLVHLLGGRVFFSYELLDEPPPYKDAERATLEAGFGLVGTPTADPLTWRPKPAFEAVRRLLHLVRDIEGHTPFGLPLRITGGDESLYTALFHRSDGKWLLCLWRSVDLYRWERASLTGHQLPVKPLPITVTFEQPRPIAVYEPSKQDLPVDSFTAQDFTWSVAAGLLVMQIG